METLVETPDLLLDPPDDAGSDPTILQAVQKLDRDILKAVRTGKTEIPRQQIRFLVDMFYDSQEGRIRLSNRLTKAKEEPNEMLSWYFAQQVVLERQIAKYLGAWVESPRADPATTWAASVIGVGPKLAAGLAAMIDMSRVRCASQIWRFAGLDNPANYRWGKGEKRPWNARLKTHCWKIGASFIKQSAEVSFFRALYDQRKALEKERNDAGKFTEVAAQTLRDKKFKDKNSVTKLAYEAGRLPDIRVHLRAQRYAVKMFLSCWFQVAYRHQYGEEAPKPFAIAQLGHAKLIAPETVSQVEAAARERAKMAEIV